MVFLIFIKKFLNHIVEIEFLDYCYYLNKRFLIEDDIVKLDQVDREILLVMR